MILGLFLDIMIVSLILGQNDSIVDSGTLSSNDSIVDSGTVSCYNDSIVDVESKWLSLGLKVLPSKDRNTMHFVASDHRQHLFTE